MKSGSEKTWRGISVSSGIAIGTAFVIGSTGVAVPEYDIPANGVEKELKRLASAISKTQKQLTQLKQKASSLSGGGEDIALLLEAYGGMLSPTSRLVKGAEKAVSEDRINAEAAVQKQIAAIKAGFEAMKDDYLAARAADVSDAGSRLIRNLLQQNYNPFSEVPENSIIIAEEITPADAALLDPKQVAGLAAVLGGAEGHAAIMARALGLPAVFGIAGVLQEIEAGDVVIIDGRKGEIIASPKDATLTFYKQELAKKQREDKKLKSLRDVPAISADGTPLILQANLELPRDVDTALEAG
jgi:phosphoenolpyruvate-protein phosphotransferase (PTS system enzyme I)